MIANRSIPAATIIPVIAYDDVAAAAAWLCDAFGFAERLVIGDHRIQLTFGGGAVVVAKREPGAGDGRSGPGADSIMVRVDDVDALVARASAAGAHGVRPPADFPYGERQCTVVDPGGHAWTFTQSIADVHPESWGGVLREG